MGQFTVLAWRNLWRNRRRTMITLAAVLMAVVLAIAIRSMQKGVYGNMIGNAVRFSTGYIQIHARGYWDDQTINNSFADDTGLDGVLARDDNVALAVPRLESYALASSGPHTKGVGVMGIDPLKEDKMNGLAGKVIKGRYFHQGGNQGVIIGDGLSEYLGLGLGDTLVLLGQGYHGSTAAGKFVISGIFHYPVEEFNNSMVFLSLPDAQDLFDAPHRLTSVSLMLNRPGGLKGTMRLLRKALDSTYEVMDWTSMDKSLVQEIQADNSGGIIMLGILYVVVSFGVFGTILMMTVERKKEFATMIALGIRRFHLTVMVMLETVYIGLLGILAGSILLLPVLIYFHLHPVLLTGAAADAYRQFGIEPLLPASLDPVIFLNQGITVFCIAVVSVVYPLIYINRFPLAETLKQ